ncbi:VOC family protein [Candidatus Woesebacteria bacterium]|nr:VOC family protein [Candidatus Woesebacteria bacterium]
MLNLNSVLVFSENPQTLVDFYKKVFQKEPDWSGGDFHGFSVGSGNITFGPHDKVHGKSQEPERVMFNLEILDVKGEFERIKNLGATVIAEPYQPEEEASMWIATFADPDGNYFQIMTPYKGKN